MISFLLLRIHYLTQIGSFKKLNLPWVSHKNMPSHSVTSDSLRPYGLQPARLLCPWDSPGKNIGVVCHFLLQGIFPTQGSNPDLLQCRQTLYCLSYQNKWIYSHYRRFKMSKYKQQIVLVPFSSSPKACFHLQFCHSRTWYIYFCCAFIYIYM